MAGFSGKVRKPKAAVKLGKRVSRKVTIAQPTASELSESDDADEDFGGDEADMDEEVVGAAQPLAPMSTRAFRWQAPDADFIDAGRS